MQACESLCCPDAVRMPSMSSGFNEMPPELPAPCRHCIDCSSCSIGICIACRQFQLRSQAIEPCHESSMGVSGARNIDGLLSEKLLLILMQDD